MSDSVDNGTVFIATCPSPLLWEGWGESLASLAGPNFSTIKSNTLHLPTVLSCPTVVAGACNALQLFCLPSILVPK